MTRAASTWIAMALIIGFGIGFFVGSNQAIRSINRQIQRQQTAIANPASVHCIEKLGGIVEISNEANGQVGYCHLKDGRVCEEWALFRDGSCKAPN